MKATIIVLLVAVSSNAVAEWLVVDSTGIFNASFSLYADSSSIRKEGNIAKVSFLADYKEPQVKSTHPHLKPYLSIQSQTEFDCKERKSRVLLVAAYPENMGRGDGMNMSGGGAPEIDTAKWWPVPPNGHIVSMLEFACGTERASVVQTPNPSINTDAAR